MKTTKAEKTIAKDPRVSEISDERNVDSVIWIYLKGHCNSKDNNHDCAIESCVHAVRATSWNDAKRQLKTDVKTCTCDGCKTPESPGGGYVEFHDEKRNILTLYGPFPTKDAAARGRFFSRPEVEHDAFRLNNPTMLFNYGTYDKGEISSVLLDMRGYGYNALHVLPASALKPIALWASFEPQSPGFSDRYFADLFRLVFKRDPVLTKEATNVET